MTVEGCSITGNRIVGTFNNTAVISVSAVDPENLLGQQQDTILRLQQCNISDNIASHNLLSVEDGYFSDYKARIFSDISLEVHYTDRPLLQTASGETQQSSSEPLADAPANRTGITAASPWFVMTQEVWCLSVSCRCGINTVSPICVSMALTSVNLVVRSTSH